MDLLYCDPYVTRKCQMARMILKEVELMKAMYLKLLSVLAAFAGAATAVAVNSACCLVLYEPEMPKELD